MAKKLETTFSINGRLFPDPVVIETHRILGFGETYFQRAINSSRDRRNLREIRRVVGAVFGNEVAPKMKDWKFLGARIDNARNVHESLELINPEEAKKSEYANMEYRLFCAIMPHFEKSPDNEQDVEDFKRIFKLAARGHDLAEEYLRNNFAQSVLDHETLTMLQMMQESKAANDPMELVSCIFDEDPKRSYEATRKFIWVLHTFKAYEQYEQENGSTSEFLDALRRQKVYKKGGGVTRRSIIARLDSNGKCIEWREYDPAVDEQLKTEPDENGVVERLYSLPPRETMGSIEMHFEDRGKSPASLGLKAERKLETHDDGYATRIVLNEHKGNLGDQAQKLLQEITQRLINDGYEVIFETDSDNYINTLQGEKSSAIIFQVTVDAGTENERVLNYTLPEYTPNRHNKHTSNDRTVLQAKLRIVKKIRITTTLGNGVTNTTEKIVEDIPIELQLSGTQWEITRQTSKVEGDPVYKTKQVTSNLDPDRPTSLMEIFYPQHYAGVDFLNFKYKVVKINGVNRIFYSDYPIDGELVTDELTFADALKLAVFERNFNNPSTMRLPPTIHRRVSTHNNNK